MARVKLSEFRAKNLVFQALGQDYRGVSIDLEDKDYSSQLAVLDPKGLHVVKVDQAVKKRNKSGLVKVKLTKRQAVEDLRSFAKLGYRYALVEPYMEHEQKEEHYVSLARTEQGVELSYSPKGGVDVEEHTSSLQHALLGEDNFKPADNTTGIDNRFVTVLYRLFQDSHMTLLEINPCMIRKDTFIALDAAVEVDSAARFFVDGAWNDTDIRQATTRVTEQETAIEALNAKSPASFSLKVLNPSGSIFLLLSGGGASVVIADEFSNAGLHSAIANYGEYSGNPSEEETYLYAAEILRLLLASEALKKQLIIAGGVANFTDVAKTFTGIIRAIREVDASLKSQKVHILVRRGGPNQTKGLRAMEDFLANEGISHEVYGPELSVADAVARSVRRK